MQLEEDLKQLESLWHQLTPAQRKIIAIKARLYMIEKSFYLIIIFIFLFIAYCTIPVPKKIQAHFL